MEQQDFLTEEEKKKIVEQLESGDIGGLNMLKKYIYERAERHDMSIDLCDIVSSVIDLNGMVAYGETFDGIYCDHYEQIWELYYTMKMELLELCGITDEYWEV